MSDEPSPSKRIPDGLRAAGLLAIGWTGLIGGAQTSFAHVESAAREVSETLGATLTLIEWAIVSRATFMLLVLGTIALPLASLARWVARARVRAGLASPVDMLRAWIEAHPWAVRIAAVLPALHWAFGATRTVYWYTTWIPRAVLAVPAAAFALGFLLPAVALIYRLGRAGIRSAVAPMKPEARVPTTATDDRLTFDAVAVTRSNLAVIALVALLPLVTTASIQVANFQLRGALAMLAAQGLMAAWAARSFSRRSKIALGVDGLYVTGTRLRRFYAYKDLDAPVAGTADILLRVKGKTVLRLQLYGSDAWLRDTVLERLDEAIRSAKNATNDGAAQLLATASDDDLARLAKGAGDYRTAHVTRDQLWDVLAHPSHEGGVRVQAARALVNAPRAGDHERLLATAERCTEPGVRVAIERVAEQCDDDEPEDAAPPTTLAARIG